MVALRSLVVVPAILVAVACGDDAGSGGSSSGGADASGSGANGSGASAGSGGGAGGGGDSGGSSQAGTGTGGSVPACVTDVVLLAEQGVDYECDFTLAPEHADADINLVLEVGGASQVICWRASSQGCDVGGFPGGWWYSGDGVLLCDSTCTSLVETEGAKLYLWVGCPNDTCL